MSQAKQEKKTKQMQKPDTSQRKAGLEEKKRLKKPKGQKK